MQAPSSATPPSDQLDRIEHKLDEVLAFRDQLQQMMAGFASGGTAKVLGMLARGRC